jgi:predicted ribosomally synthesized peptide with SipW-like signal peptide
MKKILGLTVAAFLVMGLVGGGTWAYFSDTETSTGNMLAAGTLDLDWAGGDNGGEAVFSITSADGWPGNSGSAYQLIKNSGSFTGELDVALSGLVNTESSGGTEYEGDAIGTGGELGAFATIVMWIDTNVNGTFDDGTDTVLLASGANSTSAASYASAADDIDTVAVDGPWDAVINMDTNDEFRFYVDWAIPGATTDNTAQGDSVNFTITFTLEQTIAD